MFKKNVGSLDRIIRIAIGVAMLVAYAVTGMWPLLIGIVPLATGLMSSCAIYSVLGLSTCPIKKT